MFRKIVFLILVVFLVASCSNNWDSVKRGLTGAKKNSTDEFLVKKKDPLILPPNFDDLPTPDDYKIVKEEITSFEKTLSETTTEDISKSTSSTTEESILKKIKNK